MRFRSFVGEAISFPLWRNHEAAEDERLALHCADGKTGNEVSLEERIRAGDGDYDDDRDGHTHGLGGELRLVLLQRQTDLGVVGDVLDGAKDVIEQRL